MTQTNDSRCFCMLSRLASPRDPLCQPTRQRCAFKGATKPIAALAMQWAHCATKPVCCNRFLAPGRLDFYAVCDAAGMRPPAWSARDHASVRLCCGQCDALQRPTDLQTHSPRTLCAPLYEFVRNSNRHRIRAAVCDGARSWQHCALLDGILSFLISHSRSSLLWQINKRLKN